PLAPRGHPRGRGRPPIDKALVLRVAVEYDRALQRKDRRRVNHIVAARLKLTPARVRALVHQARKERFLTKTHQGVPGGQLTPVALARLPRQPKGTRRKLGGRRPRPEIEGGAVSARRSVPRWTAVPSARFSPGAPFKSHAYLFPVSRPLWCRRRR